MTKDEIIESLKTDQEAVKAMALSEIESFYAGMLKSVDSIEVIIDQGTNEALKEKVAALEAEVASLKGLIKKLEEILSSYKG